MKRRISQGLGRLGVAGVGALLLVGGGMGCEDWRTFWHRQTLAEDVKAIEDPIFADERRQGIVGIQRRPELKEEIYQERFRQMARVDEAPAVRGQAVRALNQGRDEKAVPIYLVSLNDSEARVRLEAAKALRHLPDERAIPRLLELAKNLDEDRDVRIWATVALGSYPRLVVARDLVNLLSGRDFGVAFAAHGSLKRMTGKDFSYDEGLWSRWLTGNAPFARAMPTTQP